MASIRELVPVLYTFARVSEVYYINFLLIENLVNHCSPTSNVLSTSNNDVL